MERHRGILTPRGLLGHVNGSDYERGVGIPMKPPDKTKRNYHVHRNCPVSLSRRISVGIISVGRLGVSWGHRRRDILKNGSGVRGRNDPFMRASALQSTGRDCSPAPDVVL